MTETMPKRTRFTRSEVIEALALDDLPLSPEFVVRRAEEVAAALGRLAELVQHPSARLRPIAPPTPGEGRTPREWTARVPSWTVSLCPVCNVMDREDLPGTHHCDEAATLSMEVVPKDAFTRLLAELLPTVPATTEGGQGG